MSDDVERVVVTRACTSDPTASAQTAPAKMPSRIEVSGVRKAQAGVMATRPATAPEAAPTLVGRPSRILSTTSQAPNAAAGGDLGVHERDTGQVVRGQRGAGVEAEPAEPQQAGAEQHERHVVRAHRVLAEADPLAEHQTQRQRGGAGVDVHRGAAGEVLDAPAGQPAPPLPSVPKSNTQCATGK